MNIGALTAGDAWLNAQWLSEQAQTNYMLPDIRKARLEAFWRRVQRLAVAKIELDERSPSSVILASSMLSLAPANVLLRSIIADGGRIDSDIAAAFFQQKQRRQG